MIVVKEYRQFLIERLEEKGIVPELIRPFLRNLAMTLMFNPQESLVQVNERLHTMGWDDIDLDYRTFELATTCFELEEMKETKPEERKLM